MKKTKILILTLILSIIGSLSFAQKMSDTDVLKELKNAANQITMQCPMMIDATTRLDNVRAYEPKNIQYIYTITQYSIKDVNISEVKSTLESTFINKIRTTPAMAILRDNSVTIIYTYYDKDGIYMFDITIPPYKYKYTY